MAAFLITKASVSISASTLQNCLRRGPVLTHHSCQSLGFLDTDPLASSTPSSPGRLLPSTFLLCPCWLPPKQPCSPKQIFLRHCTGFSSGTRLPSFLEREALSVLTGWSLHLPPRGFRGPSQDRLSLLQQLPTGASGRPAASEEPARWEQQVKGSENYINTGTRSH